LTKGVPFYFRGWSFGTLTGVRRGNFGSTEKKKKKKKKKKGPPPKANLQLRRHNLALFAALPACFKPGRSFAQQKKLRNRLRGAFVKRYWRAPACDVRAGKNCARGRSAAPVWPHRQP